MLKHAPSQRDCEKDHQIQMRVFLPKEGIWRPLWQKQPKRNANGNDGRSFPRFLFISVFEFLTPFLTMPLKRAKMAMNGRKSSRRFLLTPFTPFNTFRDTLYLYKWHASVQTKIGEVKFAKTHVVLIGLGWGCLATQVHAHNLPLDPFHPSRLPHSYQGFLRLLST